MPSCTSSATSLWCPPQVKDSGQSHPERFPAPPSRAPFLIWGRGGSGGEGTAPRAVAPPTASPERPWRIPRAPPLRAATSGDQGLKRIRLPGCRAYADGRLSPDARRCSVDRWRRGRGTRPRHGISSGPEKDSGSLGAPWCSQRSTILPPPRFRSRIRGLLPPRRLRPPRQARLPRSARPAYPPQRRAVASRRT
jgi:hypothetical protein